ncbi:iron-containing redox enzyme family protein [Sphingomonas sp. PB2P19]|uniref:iron-containing redox enzyme family protein n=1 Tax=Sphingomonas rhamnosi TaxID=3096156 RepID=UPI002FC96C6B
MLATRDVSVFDRLRLRENIWQVTQGEPTAFVETPDGCFEIATEQALAFLRIRPHCTPHNSVADIAARSDVPAPQVAAMLASLTTIGLVGGHPSRPTIERLKRIVDLWSGELARDFIGNALIDEDLPRPVLLGWLLETYHYVRDFPDAIAAAAALAPEGALKALLVRYGEEERGHERFVVETLVNMGLSAREVIDSRPLVSTRAIGWLMRDLFATAPASVLLMAALVEAQELPDDGADGAQALIETRYDLPKGALAPYFAHQKIDAQLGHQQLFEDHLDCFDIDDAATLDRVVDKLHDLKHGFDLQGLEIRRYYGSGDGAYLPRQPMSFGAI